VFKGGAEAGLAPVPWRKEILGIFITHKLKTVYVEVALCIQVT